MPAQLPLEAIVTTVDLSAVLSRIAYKPAGSDAELSPIPWPAGLEPVAQPSIVEPDGSLPQAECLIVTFTAAEAMALADVLTPKIPHAKWPFYSKGFASYEADLTSRSPAKEVRRLGEFCVTVIGGVRVACFHSQLHPATDGVQLPLSRLIQQLVADTGATQIITTGTAGGGPGTILGDVVNATAIHADCTTRLKGQPWSNEEWATTTPSPAQAVKLGELAPLLAANAHRLPAEYTTRALEVQTGHCVSLDFFGFYSLDDHYGLLKYDSQLRCEEMDDFAVALGVSKIDNPPALFSLRCASDPPMKDGSEASMKLAEQIYQRYGYTAALGSVIACWALVAGLSDVE
jgi:nucleoside phosphorylase